MRTSKLSTLLVSALAVLALAATGCKKKSETTDPPACTKAPLNASCTTAGECCSGNCSAGGTCVAEVGICGGVGATCGAASDCCEGACPNGTCAPSGSCGAKLGEACVNPADCCSGQCEGALGAKVCTSGGGGCHLLDVACTGTTAAQKNASCCTGYCNGSNVCDTPPIAGCLDANVACSGDSQCCSKVCSGGLCEPDAMCTLEGEACGSDAQCCGRICPNAGTPGATCSSSVCLQLNAPCSPTNNLCCSGVCGVGNVCAPPPSGSTGQTCATLNEACAFPGDCCSTNCQGATGGLKNGTCVPVAACNAFGDICYRGEDCCSGMCTASGGAAGRCEDAPGGCGQDGYPCASDSNCCTKKCVDLGTGAKACQPSGGCRMNGNYCDSTASCCNVNVGSSKDITCDPAEHLCTNGGSCNPPGDICGYKASQNCCHEGGGSGSAVCKPDMNGIMRCFGGWVDPGNCVDTPTHHCCYTGNDGNDPLCCIQPGDVCQFRDQCCDNSPCTMAADGVLRCTPPQCLPTGATCSTAPPPPNGYTAVQGECCAPNSCYYVGIEVGWRCAQTQPPPTCVLPDGACNGGTPCCFGSCTNGKCGSACAALDAACSVNANCCSGNCDGGFCRPTCVGDTGSCTVTADCCTGLTCNIPAGNTQGTCGTGGGGPVPTCASTDQSCTSLPCCNAPTDTCTNGVCTAPVQCHETAQVCTSGGTECCPGLQCYTLDAFENRVTCPANTPSCFCDAPSCANLTQPCSTLVPCCTGYCGQSAGTGTCTSTNPADCVCKPVG